MRANGVIHVPQVDLLDFGRRLSVNQTATVAALAVLPASTPDIDNVINQHLGNLVWARRCLESSSSKAASADPIPCKRRRSFKKQSTRIFPKGRVS
jgi:hypothetical protein